MFRWGCRLMPWVPRALGSRIYLELRPNLLYPTSEFNRSLSDLSTRTFSKVADNPYTELYFEEVFEFGLKNEDPLNDLRYFLYPSSTDPALLSLSNAGSVQTVLDIVDKLEKPNVQHLSQAVATLEHLQKLCNFIEGANYGDEYRENFAKFNLQLRESIGYQKLCSQIENNIEEFELTDLAFIMMSMRRFLEPLSSALMQKIYIRLNQNILKLDMTGLSYYSVAMRSRFLDLFESNVSVAGGSKGGNNSKHSLVWKIALAPALPHLEQSLKECDTVDDLRKIAIVFNSLSGLISEHMMNNLADKVRDFVREDKFEGQEGLKTVCKLLSVAMNKIDWHEENGDYVALLLGQVQGRAMYLQPVQALLVTKIALIFGEPAKVYYEGYHRLCQIMENHEYLSGSVPMINCINYILMINVHSMPLQKTEKILRELIASPHFSDHMTDVFDILKHIGVCNRDIADSYFEKAFSIVEDDPPNVSRLGVRYSNMYSVYGGGYKNVSFEKKLTELTLKQIESTSNPQMFASEFGLLLAYGEEISESLMKRFEAMLHQMRPVSLYLIARGVEIKMRGLGHSRRGHWQNQMSEGLPRDEQSEMIDQVEEISVAINNASLHMLNVKANQLTLSDLSFIFRNFTCRRSVIAESFFDYLTEKIVVQMDRNKVSSRFIRHLCSSIDALKPPREMPQLTERFLHFFLSRTDNTVTHTKILHKVIKLCYRSNHTPSADFLSLVTTCLVRDLDALAGKHVLDICMFLVLFRALDKQTVEAVFSNEFMARLDKEMDMCGRKAQYPKSLRNSLMFLNRAVVIDYPEYGVPWFHENYCKEKSKDFWSEKNTPDRVQLKSEVYTVLCDMLGGWQYVKENSFSQYYNKIDYEVVLDSSGRPVNLYQDGTLPTGVVKYAVQCYNLSKFTQDTRRLNGHDVLESRQLAALGWQVIGVNPFSWNSLKMGEAKAKTEYLETEMRAIRSNL